MKHYARAATQFGIARSKKTNIHAGSINRDHLHILTGGRWVCATLADLAIDHMLAD